MSPIEAKAAQLRAQGFPLPPFIIPLPLPGGGQMFAVPGIAAAIFQAPGSGQAFAVQGDILSRYAMGTGAAPLDLTSGGGPLSPLGYPVSDETDWIARGYRQSAFENGHITWIPGKGARIHTGDEGRLSYALAGVAAHAAMLLDMKRADAKARILREEPTGGGEWCGYTLANLFKAAGMDPQFTSQFASTESLTEFGSYYQQDILRNPIRPLWIARTGDGQDLREWHAQNNASRGIIWWDELQGHDTPDIMPGDIVLFDHKAGAGADHIQVVLDWYPDARVATVVDGNGLGFVKRATRQAEVGGRPLRPGVDYMEPSPAVGATQPVSKAEKQVLLSRLEHLDVVLPGGSGGEGYVGVSCHRLTADGQRNPPPGNSEGPHSRVAAVVRPSRLDFERHSYRDLLRR